MSDYPSELTQKAFKDEYWNELKDMVLSDAESMTKKEFNDTKRFIDLLTITENEEANQTAYEVLQKLDKYAEDKNFFFKYEANVLASLSRCKNFDFIEFSKEQLDVIAPEKKLKIGLK